MERALWRVVSLRLTVIFFGFCFVGFGFVGFGSVSGAKPNDEAAIRTLEQNFMDAFKARDVDKIMANYERGDKLVAFDVVPRREYTGWDAYKKDWQDFLGRFNGPVGFDISGLEITTGGNLAYSHSFQHVSGQMKDGKSIDYTVRVTDVYRKTEGKWLIVQEHVSVPVDLATGKPDLRWKP